MNRMYARRTVVCEPAAHPRTLGNGDRQRSGQQHAASEPVPVSEACSVLVLPFLHSRRGRDRGDGWRGRNVPHTAAPPRECSAVAPPPRTPADRADRAVAAALGSCWGRSGKDGRAAARAGGDGGPHGRQERPCASGCPLLTAGVGAREERGTPVPAIDWMRKDRSCNGRYAVARAGLRGVPAERAAVFRAAFSARTRPGWDHPEA